MRKRGISLITLIITIVVLLILTGAVILNLIGENGVIQRAKEASFKERMSEYKSQVYLYALDKVSQDYNTDIKKINAGELLKQIVADKVIVDIKEEDIKYEIEEIIKEVKEKEKEYIVIYKGELYYVSSERIKDNEKQIKWCNEINIPILNYTNIEEDIKPGEKEYVIIYNKNDGSGESITQNVEKGAEVELEINKFTRGGYELEGWYENIEGTGEKITKVSNNIEVYAKWKEKEIIESSGEEIVDGITYSDSYEIWNKKQLENFRNRVNGEETFEGCIIKQKADININLENWTPIGSVDNAKAFSGTYDGEENIIEGIKINTTTNYQGLFGNVKNGTLKNIIVDGNIEGGAGTGGLVGYITNGVIDSCINKADVTHKNVVLDWTTGTVTYVGGVAGLVEGTTQIQNTSNEGIIKLHSTGANTIFAGGIVGFISEKETGTVISNCNNKGEIKISEVNNSTTNGCIGGIVGILNGGKILQCYNTANITSIETNNITSYSTSGGIIGYCKKKSSSSYNSIEQCWNSGNIENTWAGGIVGYSDIGHVILNCYNNSKAKIISNYKCGISTTGTSPASGGISGINLSTIRNCYNQGDIECKKNEYNTVYNHVGGITGVNGSDTDQTAAIYNSYNIGTISLNIDTTDNTISIGGGITGTNKGTIQNTYNQGEIKVNTNVKTCIGGVVGWNHQKSKGIKNSYNIGTIDLNAYSKGGIVAISNGTGSSNIYYLNQSNLYAIGGGTSTLGIKTSNEMKSLISSGDLSSTDWVTNSGINSGYPHLKVFDDTSIWLRDNNINDGDPYLRYNPPVNEE